MTPISVARVGEHRIDRFLTAGGKVAFDDARVTHVMSPVTGRVSSILAPLGARVLEGEPLAIIDSPDLGTALADVDKARADLIAAEHELNRQRALYAAHASSKRDYENAQDAQAKARAEMARAKARAAMLTGRTGPQVSQQFTLRAPLAGEVITRSATPGMEVQGQYGGGTSVELFTIGALGRVWVLIDVYEQDLARVRLGAPVRLTFIAYPGRVFPGIVDWMSGTLDPSTRTAKVRCTLDNTERLLRPEMYATARIETEGRLALAVPRSAVVRVGDQPVVYVATTAADGQTKYERRPVMVDEDQAGEWVPVLHGVAYGEQVVTTGTILLTELVN